MVARGRRAFDRELVRIVDRDDSVGANPEHDTAADGKCSVVGSGGDAGRRLADRSVHGAGRHLGLLPSHAGAGVSSASGGAYRFGDVCLWAHPPPGAPLWPKLVFYCLASASFGSLAAITQSILPSLASHIGGDLVFFSLVWIHDGERPLIAESGADTMFWIHVAQALVFALLAVLAFVQLAKMAARQPNAAP